MKEMSVVVNQEAGVISCNFEEVKQSLQERLSEYEGVLFQEDSKTYAKKEIAQLRKEQKEVKDRISMVKAEHMKPFDEFKKQADELVGMYDKPINYINDQVAAFEEKRIAERKVLINQLYSEIVNDISDYIPLAKIYNPKWENATVKEKDIRKELTELVESTQSAINSIEMMQSESKDQALTIYKKNLSLTEAITYINNYEAQKAEILRKENERKEQEEKRKQDEAIEKARREAVAETLKEQQREVEVEARIEVVAAQAKAEVIESLTPDIEEEAQTHIYKIQVGEKGKQALEMYLDSVGIDWVVM